mmetsp:Transcript_4371/g.15363  ORF Transcript_4371/g.15363 Transcript_4371/m.15363 type:complete len:343 (-) Transcript_4371:102-1130(-)
MPLLLGDSEAVVGYVQMADDSLLNGDGHDMGFGTYFGVPLTDSDGLFSVTVYGARVVAHPLFGPGTINFSNLRPGNSCFTYTLDQFGSISSAVSGGARFDGFNQHSFLVSPRDGDVYNLISHATVNLHGRFGGGRLTAAGLALPDGHRFTVLPDRLQAVLANGEDADIVLDEACAGNVQPLVLDLASGVDEVLPPLVFVASFAEHEAVMQDPLLVNYQYMGNLPEMDEAGTRITSRFSLTMASYEVTFVTVETASKTGEASSHLKLLSHERAFLSTVGSAKDFLNGVRPRNKAHGLLGVTSGVHLDFDGELPAWELPGSFEDYRVAGDDLFGAEHRFNLFHK